MHTHTQTPHAHTTHQHITVSLEDVPQLKHTNVLWNIANKEGSRGLRINVIRGRIGAWHVSPTPHWTTRGTHTMGVEGRVTPT